VCPGTALFVIVVPIAESEDASKYYFWLDEMYGTITPNLVPFLEDDIIKCQNFTGTGTTYKGVVSDVYQPGSWFSIFKTDIVGDIPSAGDEVVRIGSLTDENRQGAVYITSNDDNAPYIDVINGIGDVFASPTIKARLGKLDGITDVNAGLSGTQTNYYGLYSDNAHLKGTIYSQSGNIAGWSITTTQLSKSSLILNASATPYIALGATSYSAGNGVWLSIASATKFRVGNASGSRMQWNDVDLQIYNSSNTLIASFGGTNTIAGWSLDNTKLYNTNIELNNSTKTIKAFKDATNYVQMYYTGTSDWGIKGVKSSSTYFQLGEVNKIAAYSFDNLKLYSDCVELHQYGITLTSSTFLSTLKFNYQTTEVFNVTVSSANLCTMQAYSPLTIATSSAKSMLIRSGDDLEVHGQNDLILKSTYDMKLSSGGRINIVKALPTSSTGNPGDLYTQLASQLGGSGTTKVVCIV